MDGLYETATSVGALTAAWGDLLADDRADGVLGPGTKRFGLEADADIAELAQALDDRTFHPRPLTLVKVRKDDGGYRELSIPSVGDRIVEKALSTVLAPIVDTVLAPSAYAYRAGLGVADAVQRICRLREEARW